MQCETQFIWFYMVSEVLSASKACALQCNLLVHLGNIMLNETLFPVSLQQLTIIQRCRHLH